MPKRGIQFKMIKTFIVLRLISKRTDTCLKYIRTLCPLNYSHPKSTMNRGALIVLEGCDRCGKTTQSKMLVDSLRQKGIKTEWMAFPDRSTQIGSLISNYLMSKENLEDHVIHLLFAANRWELKKKMLCLLNSGTTLIVDRYSFSGVAFSAAKETMDFNWCLQPEAGLPSPDLVLFLELSAEEAIKRGQFGEERYETPEIQKSVRSIYNQLKTDCWKVVDADTSIGNLQQELVMLCENVIKGIGDSQIKSLW